MAFLFNGYQATDDAADQKQNIFSSGSAPATQTDGGNASDVIEKTSADGGNVSRGTSDSSSGGTSAGAAPRVTSSGAYNPKAAQSAYGRIAQNLQLPTQSISKAQGAIQQGQQNLQEESNRYAEAGQTAAAGYKLDQDTLNKAVSGDDKAFQTTAQRLSSARPEVEAFKGIGQDLPDVSAIKDPTKAYAPEAGPNYTAGQSRFDAALLRRNPEYLKLQQQILGQSAALGKENEKAIEEKTAAQREQLSKAYTESTDEIRKQLGGLGQEVMTAAQKKEAEEDQRRAGLSESEIAASEFKKLKEKIREDLKGADPRSQQYRSAQYLDSLSPDELKAYVNVDRDTDWREFIDKSGADRYNRAQGLLGSGEMLTPSEMGAGSDYAFDEGNAYKKILETITGQRARQDQTSQAEMDAIIAAATQRAQGYNERDAGQDAKAAAMKSLGQYARGKYGTNAELSDLAQLHAQDLFQNPELYQQLLDQGLLRENTGGTDWRSTLLSPEVEQLNRLSQDLGGLETFTQGGYRDEFEQDSLERFFDQYVAPFMDRYKANQAPAPQPARGSSSKGMAERPRFQDVR